jgi:predicted PurR-regulated permease PerM
MKSRLESVALGTLIFLLIGGLAVLLYLARAAFVPVAFSLLFALVLSSPVELLHRVGMPRTIGATLILVILIGIVGVTLDAVWAPARAWITTLPHTIEVIEHKLGPVARVLEHGMVAVDSDTHAPSGSSGAEDFAMNASGTLLGEAPSITVNVLTIVILTLFLLAGGAPMTARVAATLTSEGKSLKVLKVVQAVRSEIARYYATVAMINLGLGAATATVTMLLGLPNPLLWGAMATVLNFIPYAGSAITLIVLTLVAFVTFDSIGHVAAVAASFLLLVTIEGQVVEPLLIGRRLKLSPVVVFLALWFGGWFWGIAGVILAIPALVALKVTAEQSKSKNSRILFELLSPIARKHHRFIKPKMDRTYHAEDPTAGG